MPLSYLRVWQVSPSFTWFVPRCWREIDYVFMLGEVVRRYGLEFERRHITALSRQMLDEAEHYDTVARIVERLGGRVPVVPPNKPVTDVIIKKLTILRGVPKK